MNYNFKGKLLMNISNNIYQNFKYLLKYLKYI